MNIKINSKLLRRHWDKILLVLFITIYVVTLSVFSILRHNAFASNFDLSNMDHTVWNTMYGNFFSLRFHDDYVSRLSVHADFILILLSPLYLIWDDVRILLISQAFFLGLGGIPTYLLAYKILKNKIASLTIVLVFLLNPPMIWTNIYDFHPVSLVVPFFLFAFYFAYTKRWVLYSMFVLLAILTKENQSLNIAMMGLAIFFVFKNRKIGLVTFIGGIFWFILMVFVVMPGFSPDSIHWALKEYDQEIVPSTVLNKVNPINFLNTFLLDKESRDYYSLLLKPFAFIPILGLPWILMSLPSVLINVLRDTKNIVFHYGTGIIPSLVIATIFGFSYLSWFLVKIKKVKPYSKYIMYLVCMGMVLVALRVNYHYSPLPTTPSCWCFIYNVTEEDKAFEKELQSIPKDASITASLEVRPHVNHRSNVWFVPSATRSAQFIALITQNRIIGNYEPKEYENELIPILLSSKTHKVKFRSEHFYLFERVDYKK